MKKILTKRNIYITLFAILYSVVALVSLIHSFSFFGLANNDAMAIMLGTAFEIGQAAVLFAILTSSRDRSRVMPWALMVLLTLVQIIGNVFSSYKYLMQHNVTDLQYFKEPIFIWMDLPDAQATVIITYVVGAILPIVALCMTSMIANYLEDNKKQDAITKNERDETDDDSFADEISEKTVDGVDEIDDVDDETNKVDVDEIIKNTADGSRDEINTNDVDTEHRDSHFINL